MTAKLLCLAVALAVASGGCGTTSHAQAGRSVMSQYNGWSIDVAPSTSSGGIWRARVRVWPRDVDPKSHPGIVLRFTDTAATEGAIVTAAMNAARAYVDDSTLGRDRQAPIPKSRHGATVTGEHRGWTIRITPWTAATGISTWRADVYVWPPGRNPASHGGIQIRFNEVASDERAVVESALSEARRYIDASRPQH